MTLPADLNNAPVPSDWLLTGVTPAVDNPKARWITSEGRARLTFVVPEPQDINVYLVVAYPFRLQTLSVTLNGHLILSGESHEAWYKQFLSVDVPAQAGPNVLEISAGGPSGQPEGYLRLNQLILRPSQPVEPAVTRPINLVSGVLALIIMALAVRRWYANRTAITERAAERRPTDPTR